MPSKIGYNSNVDSSAFNVLSNAVVTDPAGEQVSIVSTSTHDAVGDTNIQAVKLRYLDSNWIQHLEVIPLNGTTPVLSIATDVKRIEAFEAVQTGSGSMFGGADGTITVKDAATTTNLYAQIDPTFARFQRALHYVRPGKSSLILDYSLDSPTAGGVIFGVFVGVDYTSIGGGICYEFDAEYVLVDRILFIEKNTLSAQVMCDATQSTVPLAIGIAVKALTTSQTALATFHFIDSK